jgi:hypothetical protein
MRPLRCHSSSVDKDESDTSDASLQFLVMIVLPVAWYMLTEFLPEMISQLLSEIVFYELRKRQRMENA